MVFIPLFLLLSVESNSGFTTARCGLCGDRVLDPAVHQTGGRDHGAGGLSADLGRSDPHRSCAGGGGKTGYS